MYKIMLKFKYVARLLMGTFVDIWVVISVL
jgi:hypothetical protein